MHKPTAYESQCMLIRLVNLVKSWKSKDSDSTIHAETATKNAITRLAIATAVE